MGRMAYWAIAAIALIALVLVVSTSWPPKPEDIFDFEGPRIVALAALLIVFLGSLIASRPAWREVAKAVLVWGGLGLILVGLYAYKDELETVGRRTLAVLVPGMAVEDGNGAGALMVARGGDGHFRVAAQVNNATVDFLVDTGATSVVLTSQDARAAGLAIDRLSYTVAVSTANGTAYVAPVRLERLAIGDSIALGNTQAFVAADGALRTSLLGMNVLGKLSSWEMRGNRLILRP